MKIVDGKGKVFGRLASRVAKMLLNGEHVAIINAQDIVISGNAKDIIEKFKTRRSLQHKGTPEYSPKWPRVPYLLVKRMIRGMLPFKKTTGREAFKRLRVYEGEPQDLKGERVEITTRAVKKGITIKELCKALGWSQ